MRLLLIAIALPLLASAAPALAADAEAGHIVFDHWCAPCHAPGVQFHPGTGALQEKYKGAVPAALEQRTDLSAAVVKGFVRKGVSVMAPFRKTEIDDTQLDDVAAYLAHRAPAAGK